MTFLNRINTAGFNSNPSSRRYIKYASNADTGIYFKFEDIVDNPTKPRVIIYAPFGQEDYFGCALYNNLIEKSDNMNIKLVPSNSIPEYEKFKYAIYIDVSHQNIMLIFNAIEESLGEIHWV